MSTLNREVWLLEEGRETTPDCVSVIMKMKQFCLFSTFLWFRWWTRGSATGSIFTDALKEFLFSQKTILRYGLQLNSKIPVPAYSWCPFFFFAEGVLGWVAVTWSWIAAASKGQPKALHLFQVWAVPVYPLHPPTVWRPTPVSPDYGGFHLICS